jgi:hypothetical protein
MAHLVSSPIRRYQIKEIIMDKLVWGQYNETNMQGLYVVRQKNSYRCPTACVLYPDSKINGIIFGKDVIKATDCEFAGPLPEIEEPQANESLPSQENESLPSQEVLYKHLSERNTEIIQLKIKLEQFKAAELVASDSIDKLENKNRLQADCIEKLLRDPARETSWMTKYLLHKIYGVEGLKHYEEWKAKQT